MSDTGTKSGTEFFYGDGADLDAMARLGLARPTQLPIVKRAV